MNIALTVLLLATGGDLRVEPLREAAPVEALRRELAPAGLRVLREGKPFVDLWFRATAPAGEPQLGPGILYPALKPCALVGLARFHDAAADFKAQKFPAGLYTLRSMVQPEDGDHHEVTDSRDFLVLCPAAADPGTDAVEAKALIKISSALNGKKHPSVLYLVKGQDGALPRVRRDEKANCSVLEVESPLRLALVIEGKVAEADDGADFSGLTWIDPKPDLQGKVVLVRWWTNGCPLCSASAPNLAELAKKAAVVSVYHPKPPRAVSADQIRAHAKAIGMPGTLALDPAWAVLDRWMPPAKRSFTSLTFVLDRKGRVRYVHPGGTIDEKDAKELSQQIDALLAEK
jgi:thiol-disulfide isomerase/thioredoxin